ncbi:hypothetical protein BOO71_0004429 [Deinococcus marmoris]|uniref:Uncharacterized protein n=1 Tax=Deinococcus marmoris TaxID=249408 RepID=A0A1U7P190_9DEIO|nr:hypothetical protein BOO71_0004429 [Deinococcus marmoris]
MRELGQRQTVTGQSINLSDRPAERKNGGAVKIERQKRPVHPPHAREFLYGVLHV